MKSKNSTLKCKQKENRVMDDSDERVNLVDEWICIMIELTVPDDAPEEVRQRLIDGWRMYLLRARLFDLSTEKIREIVELKRETLAYYRQLNK